MDILIEELKGKPNFKLLVNELTQLLQEEEERRQEFYNTISENDKAEFINGEVIMHSPVKLEHGDTSILLSSYMKYYCIKNNSGKGLYEKAMIQLTRNSYEPDIVFLKKKKHNNLHQDKCCFLRPI